MAGTIMSLWITLPSVAVNSAVAGASFEQKAWWRTRNLSSPMYSPDGNFIAFKAGVLRDNIQERRLLIVNVKKWQPVH